MPEQTGSVTRWSQAQPACSILAIVYVSRATLPNEKHLTAVELKVGCVAWGIRRLRRYVFNVDSQIYTDHNSLQEMGNF